MMQRKLLAVLLSFSSLSLLSQEEAGKENFTFSAQKYRSNLETNITYLEGDVHIESENKSLKAQYIEIHGKSGEVVAKNKIEYKQGALLVKAESAELNVKNGLGVFKDAVVRITDQLYMEGKEIARYEEDRYKLKHGKVSTCQDCPQSWSLAGAQMDVEIEGYAEIHHALVQILDTPVAYIPLAYFPVKTKRQSGLLLPQFASTDDLGFQMGIPYFWAISEDADATLEYRPMTKGGHRLWNEFRYTYSPRSFVLGNWSMTRNEQVIDVPLDRWGMSIQQKYQLTPYLTERYAGEWASDTRYSQHFEKDFRGNRLPTLVHEPSLQWVRGNEYAILDAKIHTDNLPRNLSSSDDQKEIQSLPHLGLAYPSFGLIGPVRLNWQADYLVLRRYDADARHYQRSTDPNGWIRTGDRGTVIQSVKAPLNTAYFVYEPSAEMRFDHYSFAAPGVPGSASRGRFFFNQELESEVWKVYDLGENREMKAVKHSLIPSLRWSYVPRDALTIHPFFFQKDAPRFDLFDHDSPDAAKVSLGTISEEQRLGHHHLLTAGLGTRIVGRYGTDSDRSYQEHFGANVSQDYDLLVEDLGKLMVSVFGAYVPWSIRTDMAVNVRTWKSDVRNEVAYAVSRYKLYVFQNIRSETKNYGGGGYLRAIGPWSLTADVIYDMLTKQMQEQTYNIAYESPSKCWLFEMGFNKVPNRRGSFYPNFRLSYQEQMKKTPTL
jgi:hypothetical protein